MDHLQQIPGCYSCFLVTAAKYLDNNLNIRATKLAVVAEDVNKFFKAAELKAFRVKCIWTEIRERWKIWNEVVSCVDSDVVIDWSAGTINPGNERDWGWILMVSHHFTFFSVNVTFSLLSVFLDMFVPSLS